jgi:exopolyphosphatase/guanosine-5'-triphosphate,3'-diphosphate pyrophosphatase
MRTTRQRSSGWPKPVAVIDIGASAIRAEIAEINEDGTIRQLEPLRKGVLLGNDTFTRGELSLESIRAACEVLRGFKKVMDEYGVRDIRAVATSAVREADNSDTFLDRVFMTTGIEVEIIEGPEESRLSYAAVHEALNGQVPFDKGVALLVEVGGGSADVAILDDGEIVRSATLAMGAIRLRQTVSGISTDHAQRTELYKRFIRNAVANLQRDVSLQEVDHFIAQGGDMRLVARRLKKAVFRETCHEIDKETFFEFCDRTSRLTREDLVAKYNVSYLEAETLVPALLAYSAFLKETSASSVIVPNASLRRGLLLEMASSQTGHSFEALDKHVLSSALSLAEKFSVDLAHGQHVAETATDLFDALKNEEHGLGARERLLLQVAALLHEVGMFVGMTSHHQHTYYVISAAQLFGLGRDETEIVANVARYHRRSTPKREHEDYMRLDRAARVLVCKLAALLRVADALDRDHQQKAKRLRFRTTEEEFLILVDRNRDWTMERMTLEEKGDLFLACFGKRVALRGV